MENFKYKSPETFARELLEGYCPHGEFGLGPFDEVPRQNNCQICIEESVRKRDAMIAVISRKK
jgi:hypothetical protein